MSSFISDWKDVGRVLEFERASSLIIDYDGKTLNGYALCKGF